VGHDRRVSAYLGFRWDGRRNAEVYVRDEIFRFPN
jgi:hypothetical protein